MIIELAIPQTINNKKYTHVEIQKPKGNVVANTVETIDNKNVWYGILTFVNGCIVQFIDEQNEFCNATEAICKNLYWINIQVIMVKIMAIMKPDSYVKGIYECPLCGKDITIRKENDNSIKYSELAITKGTENIQIFELIEKIEIKNKETNETIISVDSISLKVATLNDLIIVANKNYGSRQIRNEYAILAQTITAVNNEPVDNKWINIWGVTIFEKMGYDDLEKISEIKNNGGIQKELQLNCNCGEQFNIDIDTDDFFLSGLRKKNQ